MKKKYEIGPAYSKCDLSKKMIYMQTKSRLILVNGVIFAISLFSQRQLIIIFQVYVQEEKNTVNHGLRLIWSYSVVLTKRVHLSRSFVELKGGCKQVPRKASFLLLSLSLWLQSSLYGSHALLLY